MIISLFNNISNKNRKNILIRLTMLVVQCCNCSQLSVILGMLSHDYFGVLELNWTYTRLVVSYCNLFQPSHLHCSCFSYTFGKAVVGTVRLQFAIDYGDNKLVFYTETSDVSHLPIFLSLQTFEKN